jgi:hypothetical protein
MVLPQPHSDLYYFMVQVIDYEPFHLKTGPYIYYTSIACGSMAIIPLLHSAYPAVKRRELDSYHIWLSVVLACIITVFYC